MRIGLYPGCSLKGSSREYTESVYAVAKAVGIELVEIPDWNCCGATAAHNLNHELSLALPARILAIAEREGLTDILVPCAACYSRLTVTQYELHHHPELKNKIRETIEMDYKGNSKILNLIQFIDIHVAPVLSKMALKPFNYKVACYYGCLMVRPPKILNFDRVEDPQSMDNVMKSIGSYPIDWAYKTECCGAGMSVARTDIVGKLSGILIKDAVDRGAQFIIVACPMCHSNLDMRRPAINKFLKINEPVPVLYLSQAIGLALGISEKELGMQRHFVPVVMPAPVVIEEKDNKKAKKVENTVEN